MNKLFQFLGLVLILWPLPVEAGLPSQMLEDLAQKSGYVVMQVGDEYLIDLDAAKGISNGDIFAVVQKGDKVIHPVTREVIGTLDEIKGFLQVTRVKKGYSYAKLLAPAQAPIGKGDEISRFYQVPTSFLSDMADRDTIFSELKKSLPMLDWLPADSVTEPLLTFKYLTGRLVVETTPGTLLFSYPFVGKESVTAPQRMLPATVPTPPTIPVAQTAVAPVTALPVKLSGVGEVWRSDAYEGPAIALTVNDFDGDGQQEIAFVVGRTLKIVRKINGHVEDLTELQIAAHLTPLALDSADIDGDGRSEILLTALGERTLNIASQLIEFDKGDYRTAIGAIPWFLRVVELPGEGAVLIGQGMLDKQNPFSESLFYVERKGDQLEQGAFFALPQYVGIYGFALFQDEEGQLLYVYLSESGYLKVVTPEGEVLWESSDYYGGSEIRFDQQPQARDDEPIAAYIKTRILVAGDQIILAQNDGSRILQGYRKFKKSRAIALTWDGLNMSERWRTSDQGGYLNDLALADVDNDGQLELLTLVKFKHKSFFQDARSALVAHEVH